MAKAHRMTRGAVQIRPEKETEKKLPDGVHSVDGHGNVFASLGLSRVEPRYYTRDHVREGYLKGLLFEDQATAIDQALDETKEKYN